MKITISTVSLFIVIVLFTGCSAKAPVYQTDFNLVNELKEKKIKAVKVTPAQIASTEENKPFSVVQIRGGFFTSPYGVNFNEYIESAIETHLKQAGVYSENSNIEIKCKLLFNDVDSSSLVLGVTKITANVEVLKLNKQVLNKEFSITENFESSFFGATAITNGINSYPKAVVQLINKILSDDELLKVIKE